MGQKILAYDVRTIELASAVVETEITLAHRVLHIFVPSGQTAAIRFGAVDKPQLPLQSGWQRICFTESPGSVFLTAAAGADIVWFTSEDIQADFFSSAADQAPSLDAATRMDMVWQPLRDANKTIGQTPDRIWWGREYVNNLQMMFGVMNNLTVEEYAGVITARIPPVDAAFAANQAGMTGGGATMPIIASTRVSLGYSDDWARYTRFICSIAREKQGGAPDMTGDDSGHVQFSHTAGAGPFGGATAYFGIQATGAGWSWASRATPGGADDELTALTWPVSVEDFATVELRLISASALTPAKVQLWVNRSLLIERDWDSDPLPTYAGSINPCFIPGFQGGNDGAATEDFFHVRWARYVKTAHI